MVGHNANRLFGNKTAEFHCITPRAMAKPFVSREKELRKINQKLDKMANTAFERPPVPPPPKNKPPSNVAKYTNPNYAKTESRYLTYTKHTGRGTITINRKRGGGDGVDNDKSRSVAREHPLCHKHTFMNLHANRENSTSIKHNNTHTFRIGDSAASKAHAENMATKTTNGSTAKTRSENSKTPSSLQAAAVFSVKARVQYRNPKFSESASLDAIISEIQREQNPNTDGASMDEASGPSYRSLPVGSLRKQMSTDGLIKFLKSKLAVLEEDHDRLLYEISRQKELLDKALERQKQAEHQRDASIVKQNTLNEQLMKAEAQLEHASLCLKDRVISESDLQKELETAKREIKQLNQTNANLEKRLYRANDELETARSSLQTYKVTESELHDTIRNERYRKEKQINSLKRQRSELVKTIKKQIIDHCCGQFEPGKHLCGADHVK